MKTTAISCPPSFSVECHSRSLLQTGESPPSIKSLLSLLLALGSIFGLVIGQGQSLQARGCSLTTCCEPDTVLSAGDSSEYIRLCLHPHGTFIQIKGGGNAKQRKENHYILCCCSVSESCLTLCNCSTPSFPIPYYFPEFAQTHVHWISDAI